MLDQLQTLSANFKTTDHLLALSVADLNADTANHPSRHTEGPSIAWQVEHMLTHRLRILSLLTASQPAAAPSSNGAPFDLNHLMKRWSTVADDLQLALNRCTPATLAAQTRGGPHGEGTAFDLINFLSWHEAYHFGGLGSTRKVLGLAEVADLAREHHRAQTSQHAAQEAAIAS
jgi:hypothetical protein